MPFNSIFAWVMKKRIHQIDLFRKYPLEVQSELFNSLIEKAKETEFGLKFNFSQINSYADFKENVPLNTYESIKPNIDRIIWGEQNILWPTETKMFAKSSGTTAAASKFIPVTKESLEDCHFKGGKDLLALYYENFPNRKVYNGKHLTVGGSLIVNPNMPDSYLGDISAIIMKNLPWWAHIKRTPSKETALMPDWENKVEKMAIETIDEDVYILVGVPSWTYVLCKKILEISGKSNLKEVWPNLELYMHGGVSFEPYRELFQELIPSPEMNYVETYNASEGFFAIQDQQDSTDLLLMLDYGIFYEFIPMEEFEGIDSKYCIDLHDVELDKNYAIVISTNGGLWRYIIGDTVKFTSIEPFKIKITGRVKSFINIAGEELIVENAEQAIAKVCLDHKAGIKEFTVGPKFLENGKNGRHEWFIEFNKEPSDLETFSIELDNYLRTLNSDYDAKRTNDLILEPLKIFNLNSGTFNVWLKSKGKLGAQHKVPRLSNSREIIDEILTFYNP
jgi:hypothetical protein